MVLQPHNKSHGRTESLPFTEQIPLNVLSSPWKWSPHDPAHSPHCFLTSTRKQGTREGRDSGISNQSLASYFWANQSFLLLPLCFLFCACVPWGPVLQCVHFSSTCCRGGNWGPPSWRQSWNHPRFPDHWINIHSTKSFFFKVQWLQRNLLNTDLV